MMCSLIKRLIGLEGLALVLIASVPTRATADVKLQVRPAAVSRCSLLTPARLEACLAATLSAVERGVERTLTTDWPRELAARLAAALAPASPAPALVAASTPRRAASDTTKATTAAAIADAKTAAKAKSKPAPVPPRVAALFAATQHGPFDDLILGAAKRWRIDPFVLKGLLANESGLEPVRYGKRAYGKHKGERVVISGGAVGIAQFTGSGVRAVRFLRRRRRKRGELVLDFDMRRALIPQEAIYAAAELLAHLISRYGRDGGITAYNSGAVGGIAVARLGFWRARRSGRLKKAGYQLLQGEHFLLDVLQRANKLRRGAGLGALPMPSGKPRNARVAKRKPKLLAL